MEWDVHVILKILHDTAVLRTTTTPMGKPALTEAEYVDKLNDLLVQQDWYKPGMKIVLTPKGGFPHGLDLMGESNLARLPQLRKIIDQDFVLLKP